MFVCLFLLKTEREKQEEEERREQLRIQQEEEAREVFKNHYKPLLLLYEFN